jgi:deoxycytidylate deaminase
MTVGMRIALKAAERGQHPIYKMGAAIVKSGSIIAVGFNHREVHAEASAIGRRDVKGADIYVARLRCGKSKPCPKCMMLLKSSGIRKAFYFESDGSITSERIAS